MGSVALLQKLLQQLHKFRGALETTPLQPCGIVRLLKFFCLETHSLQSQPSLLPFSRKILPCNLLHANAPHVLLSQFRQHLRNIIHKNPVRGNNEKVLRRNILFIPIEEIGDTMQRNGGLPGTRHSLNDQCVCGFVTNQAVLLLLYRRDNILHLVTGGSGKLLLQDFVADADAALKRIFQSAPPDSILPLTVNPPRHSSNRCIIICLSILEFIVHPGDRRAPVKDFIGASYVPEGKLSDIYLHRSFLPLLLKINPRKIGRILHFHNAVQLRPCLLSGIHHLIHIQPIKHQLILVKVRLMLPHIARQPVIIVRAIL